MTTRRGLVVVLLSCLAACGSSGPTASYPTPAADAPLGVAWDPASGTATFRVWAPAAGSASVTFFADWSSPSPTATHPMTKDLAGGGDLDGAGWNGVWQATLTGVTEGQLYQYSLGGRAALDPYAPSMGRFDSSTQAVGRGAVLRPDTLKPLDLSTPAPDDVEEMVPFTAPEGYARRDDAIVYEVHVRDFTVLVPPGDLSHPPGTYLAFTERLDHVKRLGATHVQLLPVLAYFNGDESGRGTIERVRKDRGHNYNWGYDPHSWFAPSGMYVSYPADPAAPDVDDPRVRVRELKTLVNEAHKRGLGVTLDVVYNHTANTGILDALAPGYYYRGSNNSGVGNDTASERKMMRKLVVESVAHLVREYHLDGFRFDLMGLIDSTTMTEAYAAAAALKPGVLFIGEGWRSGGVPSKDYLGLPIEGATQDWMDATDDVAVFSDSFRDLIKGGGYGENDPNNRAFLTLASVDKGALLRNLRGDATNFTATTPADAVQYLTAHDGLTLHDKLGKILGLDPAGAEIPKVARLGFVLQATSQGIAFINGGCEFGRSKWVEGTSDISPTANWSGNGSLAYVRDSYDASDAVNGFDWALLAPGTEGARLLDYVRGLYALRRSSDAFRLGSKALATSNVTMLDDSRASAIAYRLVDSAGTTRFSVFVNAGTAAVVLATRDDLTRAGVTLVVDSDEAGPTAVATPSGFSNLTASSVTVAPRTAVVFRAPLP